MSDEPRRRLGRGLSALLGDEGDDYASLDQVRTAKPVPIENLRPGRLQPRQRFDDADLDALVESIRRRGILQPILVRRDADAIDRYEIVAGERRWRAAQRARLHEVPVLVKDLDDRDALEIALVENLQRTDLTPIEEAQAYQRLIDEYQHTQEDVAQAIGKSRSHVANTLRLLALPDAVKEMVNGGELSAGHARAILGVDDPLAAARNIVRAGLNVRQAERLARPANRAGPGAIKPPKDPDTIALERDLSNLLGLKVELRPRGAAAQGIGTLVLHYRTLDQLDGVLKRLGEEPRTVANTTTTDRDQGENC